MSEIRFMVRNRSKSEGQYFLDNEYHTLMPGELKVLHNKPVNATANITVSTFKQESLGGKKKGVLNTIHLPNAKREDVKIQDVPDVTIEEPKVEEKKKEEKEETKVEL